MDEAELLKNTIKSSNTADVQVKFQNLILSDLSHRASTDQDMK